MRISLFCSIAFRNSDIRTTLARQVFRGKRIESLVGILVLGLLALSVTDIARHVTAQGTFPDPNANCPHATCGEVSPLIPMQSTEAVHMGLIWKRNSKTPKILFHARFPEYTPNDMADPAFIDLAIARRILVCAEAGGRKHYR